MKSPVADDDADDRTAKGKPFGGKPFGGKPFGGGSARPMKAPRVPKGRGCK